MKKIQAEMTEMNSIIEGEKLLRAEKQSNCGKDHEITR